MRSCLARANIPDRGQRDVARPRPQRSRLRRKRGQQMPDAAGFCLSSAEWCWIGPTVREVALSEQMTLATLVAILSLLQ
jgi:hypothetical protein